MSKLDDEKKKMRGEACNLRRTAMAKFSNVSRDAFFANLRSVLFKLPDHSTVASFLAIGDEIDMLPIMEEIWSLGQICVLPVVIAEQAPLIFRKWSPGAKMLKGPFSTRHPNLDAQEILPKVLLVPFLAFDAFGYRLGWGGGYYDRTISMLKMKIENLRTIGVGLHAQQLSNIPKNKYDEPLSFIVTEKDIIRPRQNLGLSD